MWCAYVVCSFLTVGVLGLIYIAICDRDPKTKN
jgi:hypothetical protein